jgi:hypothetical protein
MQFGPTSEADVADSALLDLQAFTIEAWIYPTEIPATGLRAGIVDNNGQYGFFLHELGQLQCTVIGGASLRANANVAVNQWTHVACTYDGTTTTIYVNGAVVGTLGGGGAVATNGYTGISLAADNPPGAGSRLIGLIDELRITSTARASGDL